MHWFCSLVSGLLVVKALVEFCSQTEFFMTRFFFFLEKEKYSYDLAKFRVLDIITSLIASILLFIFCFTSSYWILILCLFFVLVMIFYIYAAVRTLKRSSYLSNK